MAKIFNKVVGDSGEDRATEFLKKNGYRIVRRNFKNKLGEIDVIAYDKEVLAFIEVKTRLSDTFGLPREAVNIQKQRKIRLVATSFIKTYKLFDKACRFDVVEVMPENIEIIKDAF